MMHPGIMRSAMVSRRGVVVSNPVTPVIRTAEPRAEELGTLLEEALNEAVVVNENGRRKRISKREELLKQLVNRAAFGDPRAIQLF